MNLRRGNRILLTRPSAKELRVVRKQPDPRHGLDYPLAKGTRETEFRPERPAVGAEVDELRRIVLSERRRNRDADSDDALLTVRRKLLGRHRRRAVEVHRQAHSRIGQSEPVDLRGFAQIQALHMPTHYGHDHSRVGQSAGQAERPRIHKRHRVDGGGRLIDGSRGIERHVAPVDAVGDGQDVDSGGDWPVGARLQLLRRHGHGRQQEREGGGRAEELLPRRDVLHRIS